MSGFHYLQRMKAIAPGSMINNFEIVSLIGIGGYAKIYKVKKTENDHDNYYVMKTESINSEKKVLSDEIKTIKNLKGSYFPKLYDFGQNSQYKINYYVIDLYGSSIDTIQEFYHKNIGISTAYNICLKMLEVIQTFHSS